MSDTPYESLAGRYELHRQLASGGSADVYLARDQLLNRPVAVKILSAELAEDEAFIERLRREAQLVASLNHQNIVGVFDQGEEDGAPFIVMEYVDGRSLADVLRNEGRLHPDRAAKVAIDVAAALDAAHRQGMVHMDVKPGNVLITNDGQVKLADFGIAKALSGGTETDMTIEGGQVLGTATYLSPEQAQGGKVDPRSDVYSLAVVLYEMMTGRPPFIGDSPIEIARKHVEEAPQPPRRLGVEMAQSLEAITLKGLAKSPVNRYPSVRDFAADLKRYLGGAHSLGGGAKPANRPPVRPTTGRSTPPEGDATQLISAGAPVARPAAAVPQQGVPMQSAVPQQVQTVPAEPVAAQQQVAPRDDSWRRNAFFLGSLLVLLVLLAFLVSALIDVLRGDAATETGAPDEVQVETVDVGDYRGLAQNQALGLIESLGLEARVEAEPNADMEEGRVFRQDPQPGARVELESIITIVVSDAEGQVEVPSVIGVPIEEAIRQLSRLGFTVQRTDVDNETFPAGEVVSQSPLPLQTADRNSPIQLEVSLGPSERTVPDFEGQPFNEVLAQVFDLGFDFRQEDEASEEVEKGLVLRTEPPADSLLRGGDLLVIYVSTGIAQIQVPSVEDLLVDSARQQLVTLGFVVEVEEEDVTDPADVNRVIDQSPPAFIDLEAGSTVRIIVGRAAPVETTTTTAAPQTTTTAAPETTTTEAPADDG